jgi:hypothetical protein
LHLVGLIAVLLEKHGQVNHGVKIAGRVAGDEVGNQILLLASLARFFLKYLAELFKVVARWLPHFGKHIGIGMLGGHLEIPAYVVPHQLTHVLR